VLVDGLRYDTSLQMPYLNSLRQRGAQARLMASSPSTTQTAWVTLISGAGPEVNDMPPFERSPELLQPLAIDHLFAAVRRAGRSVGIAGFQWWEKLVPPDSLDLKYYVNAEDDAADSLVVDRALVFIEQFRPNFLLVNLRQVQEAGQTFGGASAEYEQAALRCDEYIHRLAAQMDLQHSVLVVCSSHGMVYPFSVHLPQSFQVLLGNKHFGLKPAQGIGAGRLLLQGPASHSPSFR
jgi:predicted AlkP superfamily pyrophosphatase or phosphodiesterase